VYQNRAKNPAIINNGTKHHTSKLKNI